MRFELTVAIIGRFSVSEEQRPNTPKFTIRPIEKTVYTSLLSGKVLKVHCDPRYETLKSIISRLFASKWQNILGKLLKLNQNQNRFGICLVLKLNWTRHIDVEKRNIKILWMYLSRTCNWKYRSYQSVVFVALKVRRICPLPPPYKGEEAGAIRILHKIQMSFYFCKRRLNSFQVHVWKSLRWYARTKSM